MLLLLLYTIAQLWCNFHCNDPEMAQFPLHPFNTRVEGVKWKLQHLCQGGAIEIVPSPGHPT